MTEIERLQARLRPLVTDSGLFAREGAREELQGLLRDLRALRDLRRHGLQMLPLLLAMAWGTGAVVSGIAFFERPPMIGAPLLSDGVWGALCFSFVLLAALCSGWQLRLSEALRQTWEGWPYLHEGLLPLAEVALEALPPGALLDLRLDLGDLEDPGHLQETTGPQGEWSQVEVFASRPVELIAPLGGDRVLNLQVRARSEHRSAPRTDGSTKFRIKSKTRLLVRLFLPDRGRARRIRLVREVLATLPPAETVSLGEPEVEGEWAQIEAHTVSPVLSLADGPSVFVQVADQLIRAILAQLASPDDESSGDESSGDESSGDESSEGGASAQLSA